MRTWDYIANAVLSGGIAGAIVWLARTWISERIRAAIQHEYEVKLEQLRADMAKEQVIWGTAIAALVKGQETALERRLEAIAVFWKGMMDWRAALPSPTSMLDIFPEDELRTGKFLEGDFGLAVAHLDDSWIQAATSIDPPVDRARPFATPYMYGLYFAYRALLGRVVMKLQLASKRGTMEPWYLDEQIRELLLRTIGKVQFDRWDSDPAFKMLRAFEAIENRMLEHVGEIISGKASADLMLEQTQSIMAAAARLRPDPRPSAGRVNSR